MSEALERLLVGRTLVGRYEIEEVIGRGGMSVVYRARDRHLQRPVALKVVSFPPDLTEEDREGLRQRLRREAAAVARIPSHPNVVQVYDHGTDPELDVDFITMELLPGRDLRSALREGPLPAGEARQIILEAARGVAAGHRAGIVHRDVKPGNVFLVGREQPPSTKILDFGIAKALELGDEDEELTRDHRIPHSPAYASPEQLDPARDLTPASDVYQLGLVGYEVLAGERPFDDAERQRLRAGEILPVPVRGRWGDVEPHLRSAIERALRPVPEERFGDAAEFAEALDHQSRDDLTLSIADVATSPRAGDGTSDATLAAPVGVPSRAPPSAGRAAGIAVAVAGAALLIWAATRLADAPEEAAMPSDTGVAELDETFRPILFQAYENLREAASIEEGEAAAAAVLEVTAELHRTLADGDLAGHVSLYAERVDFHGARNTPRERIERERAEAIERFPRREIVLTRQAVEFTEPGRARALVDKEWHFEGNDGVWAGAGRHELILVRDPLTDAWRIVAESELALYEGDPGRS